jgi:hypothetical protein
MDDVGEVREIDVDARDDSSWEGWKGIRQTTELKSHFIPRVGEVHRHANTLWKVGRTVKKLKPLKGNGGSKTDIRRPRRKTVWGEKDGENDVMKFATDSDKGFDIRVVALLPDKI